MIFSKDDIAVDFTYVTGVRFIFHPKCSIGEDRTGIKETQTWTKEKSKKEKVLLICDKCGGIICDYSTQPPQSFPEEE